MAPGASTASATVPPMMAPAPAPPSAPRQQQLFPTMGTLPSSLPPAAETGPRIPLSRKRPAAAALPAIGLIKRTPAVPIRAGADAAATDADRKARERFESDSGSQSSLSSSGSAGSPSDDLPIPAELLQFRLDEPSSSSSTPGSSRFEQPPAKQHLQHLQQLQRQQPTPGLAAARAGREGFHNRQVVIEKQPECARVIFCPERQPPLGPLLESGSLINGYRIIGTGKEANALNLATNELFNCRLISKRDFETALQVGERLDRAAEMCMETDWDVEELSECVLPSSATVFEEFLPAGRSRYILFTPFEYSNLHVIASAAATPASPYGLPEERVQQYFQQVAAIIAFCHQCGIVVRDLKPRKLVFSNETQTKIRLSDVFDVAVCDNVENDIVTEKFGSPAYIPPEVLTARSSGFAGRPADVWGLGVLTFLLLSGRYPFYDSNPRGVFKKIRRAAVCFPAGLAVSRAARDLVHCMLRKRPAERPDAALLAKVPWRPVKDTYAVFRERVNHMISPHVGPAAARRPRGVMIPHSDVLTEQVVPERALRITPDGAYVGRARRAMAASAARAAADAAADRAVPRPLPLARYPLNEWPYATELESRIAVESRLPLRERFPTEQTRPAAQIPHLPAHFRI